MSRRATTPRPVKLESTYADGNHRASGRAGARRSSHRGRRGPTTTDVRPAERPARHQIGRRPAPPPPPSRLNAKFTNPRESSDEMRSGERRSRTPEPRGRHMSIHGGGGGTAKRRLTLIVAGCWPES